MYARIEVISAVIIEDDPVTALALCELLEHEGLAVRSFSNTDEAFESCCQIPPDVLISDWCVPGRISPASLVRELKKISNKTRVLFVSGFDPQDVEAQVGDVVGVEYLTKPVDFEKLLSDIHRGTDTSSDERSLGVI